MKMQLTSPNQTIKCDSRCRCRRFGYCNDDDDEFGLTFTDVQRLCVRNAELLSRILFSRSGGSNHKLLLPLFLSPFYGQQKNGHVSVWQQHLINNNISLQCLKLLLLLFCTESIQADSELSPVNMPQFTPRFGRRCGSEHSQTFAKHTECAAASTPQTK